MAEKVRVSEQYLQDIADSIRTKLETEDKYKPSEFSSKIDEMNIMPSITKGIIIKACNSSGYATDAEIVGMTQLPIYYCANNQSGGPFKNLTNLKLPSDLTVIGMSAFENCFYLALTELPDSVTGIGSYAFRSCQRMPLKKLSSNLTTIDEYTFYYCSALNLEELPSGLISIGRCAFERCGNLTLSELPESITSIGDSAFAYCDLRLTKLPSKLKVLNSFVFRRNYNLALTELPDELTSIGQYCFEACTNLAIKEIPEGVTSLPDQAIRDVQGITELTFKGNMTKIGTMYNITNMVKVVLPNNTTVPTLSSGAFDGSPIKSGTGYIYVPDTLLSDFQSATNWSKYASQIKGLSELEVSE